MSLNKVRVQLLDPTTGVVLQEVDVLTSADSVLFADGQTFQQKLDAGILKGSIGAQGVQGIQGEAFSIAKVYASVALMNAGYATDGLTPGKFVMIDTGSINDTDTGKLYVKGVSSYNYIADLSGATGVQGPQGVQGIQGAKGDKGDTGVQGAIGSTGIQGIQGIQGIKGVDGATWISSTGVPTTQGKTGDYYLNTTNFDIYSKATGSWVLTGNIKGATGVQGIQGATGSTGLQGTTGATGAQGIKGDTGVQGIQGIQGVKGDTGDTVKIGTTYDTSTTSKLFFKLV